jgi:hypothetical protein
MTKDPTRILWPILMCMAVGGPLAAPAAELPNFSGTWLLNLELSERPTAPPADREHLPRGGGKGSHQGGRRGGQGGRAGGPGAEGRGADSRPQQPAAGREPKPTRNRVQEMSRLEIFHDGPELNLTDGLAVSRLLFTDGRATTIWAENGEVTTTAVWQGADLVISWQTPADGAGRVQRFALSEDGRRLTVHEQRRVPGGEEFRSVTFVYDRRE